MNYRRLGNSGLLVSELALGTMIFGEDSARGVSEVDALRLIDAYRDAGGNHLDVADVYAGGRAEEIVGGALKGKRSGAIVASKVRWPMGKDVNQAGLSRHHIIEATNASLARLGVETIDVLYMHGWDALTPLDESLRAMDDLVSSGKARYLGVSNFMAWQAMKALGVSEKHGWSRFVAGQYQYSLVVRDIENEFGDFWVSEGVGLVPWGPLGGGFLSGKYQRGSAPPPAASGRIGQTPDDWEESWARRDTDRNWRTLDIVQRIVAAHPGSSPAQVSIAWLLAQPGVSSVVVGARTEAQLRGNLGAAELQLSADELTRLTAVSDVGLSYPARAVNTRRR